MLSIWGPKAFGFWRKMCILMSAMDPWKGMQREGGRGTVWGADRMERSQTVVGDLCLCSQTILPTLQTCGFKLHSGDHTQVIGSTRLNVLDSNAWTSCHTSFDCLFSPDQTQTSWSRVHVKPVQCCSDESHPSLSPNKFSPSNLQFVEE